MKIAPKNRAFGIDIPTKPLQLRLPERVIELIYEHAAQHDTSPSHYVAMIALGKSTLEDTRDMFTPTVTQPEPADEEVDWKEAMREAGWDI